MGDASGVNVTEGRRAVGPPRGILNQAAPDGTMTHDRLLPAPALAAAVAHFWQVTWSLRGPYLAETLPHPCVHITVEHDAGGTSARIGGVSTARFTRTLRGDGWVFGIKLRPGALSTFLDGEASDLAERVVPMVDLLGPAGPALARALLTAKDLGGRIAAAERVLVPIARPLTEEAVRTRDLCERMAADRTLLRAEDGAAALGVGLRTLERLFARHVGVSPKWVIRRYRLHEAADQLQSTPGVALAALAASLGYADQAHFARDFKAVIGVTPKAFAGVARFPHPR